MLFFVGVIVTIFINIFINIFIANIRTPPKNVDEKFSIMKCALCVLHALCRARAPHPCWCDTCGLVAHPCRLGECVCCARVVARGGEGVAEHTARLGMPRRTHRVAMRKRPQLALLALGGGGVHRVIVFSWFLWLCLLCG